MSSCWGSCVGSARTNCMSSRVGTNRPRDRTSETFRSVAIVIHCIHKVHIYLEYQCLFPRPNWDPPPPIPQSSVSLPPNQGGGTNLPAGEWMGSKFGRLKKKPIVLVRHSTAISYPSIENLFNGCQGHPLVCLPPGTEQRQPGRIKKGSNAQQFIQLTVVGDINAKSSWSLKTEKIRLLYIMILLTHYGIYFWHELAYTFSHF